MKIKGNRLFTFQGLQDKERRNLAVFELIRKKGIISRTDISKSTGINIVSISNYINSYIEKKLVSEKGLAASSGGRKAELIELNSKENCVVGVDVGGEGIKIVVADIGMNILAKKSSERPSSRKVELAGSVTKLVEEAVRSSGAGMDSVRCIGMGLGEGSLISLAGAVEKNLGKDTLAGGSAACAAFAERRLNPGADADRLLYMHSDLGRGIIIDGDTASGCSGRESELYILAGKAAKKSAAQPYDEKTGYLRPWNSYMGVTQIATREVSDGIGTKIVAVVKGDTANITEEAVVEAARQGDDVAVNIIESVALNMGLRIAYIVNLFSPQLVVVGGGPEKAGDMFFGPVNKMVGELALRKQAQGLKIIPGILGEDAASLGAAALAARELFLKS